MTADTLQWNSPSNRRRQPAAGPLPAAYVESGWTGRHGDRCVRTRCPYCRRLHTHGWPADEPDVGSRRAHCGGGDYRVTGGDTAVPASGADHDRRRGDT